MEEATLPVYFGEWLKFRRKELDLTQAELAQRAGCSLPALRKIEAGVRRPSKQLAGLLARSLEIPPEDQTTFIRVARGELNVERLLAPPHALSCLYKPALKSSPTLGNLPSMLTPFIGREPEIASVSKLLQGSQCRLLTLIGPGGIGKTRLAIEVARRTKELFPDGIWFVPLASLNSSEYLIPMIADSLNFQCHGLTNPRGNLLNHLEDKQTLLIMDNAEYFLECSVLIEDILENSPLVRILVTSRERMNLRSEWVFEIQGLPIPSEDRIEQFEDHSSVALFLQSARRIQAGFYLRNDDRQWVVSICRLLEGLPLGIELAASWVGLLSCEEIAREIERNLDFLTVSMHDLPERHRSLRATVDYSWRLLSSEEKLILSRLSVFQGSFRREAAEKICGASLFILSSLKDKSLLRRSDRDRYDLHEYIHQYAALRLAEDSLEEGRLKDQHAIYYARLLSDWEKALKGSNQIDALSEMAHEIGNLRQAWERLITCSILYSNKDSLRAPSLFHSPLFSLSLFYEMRCRNLEAGSLFGRSVDLLKAGSEAFYSPEDNWFYKTILGHIMGYLGLHHVYLLHFQQAFELLEEAISLLEKSMAFVEKAQAQIILAGLLQAKGQIQKSMMILEEARAILIEESDDWWYAFATAQLAWAYLSIGEVQKSEELYLEGFRLVIPGDLRLEIPFRNGIALTSYLQGDTVKAELLLKENLDLSFQLGSKRKTAICYRYLGQVALATNQIELAKMNFDESAGILSEFGESDELAISLIYTGICLTRRLDTRAAREKFLIALQIGQSLNIFYLVYWGLVYLARILMLEGLPEKALGMMLLLQHYSVELKVAQDDGVKLLAELQAMHSPEQIAAVSQGTEGMGIDSLLERI